MPPFATQADMDAAEIAAVKTRLAQFSAPMLASIQAASISGAAFPIPLLEDYRNTVASYFDPSVISALAEDLKAIKAAGLAA